MSRAEDKASTFNNIRAMNSANMQGKMPKQQNSMSSINNKSEPIPYMLDLLKVVAGTEALKLLIGGMLTKVVSGSEPKLKTALKNQFIQSNADENLPTEFKNNGVDIPVSSLDTTKKYQVDPTSVNTGGNLLYDEPNINNFDYNVSNSLRLSGQPVPTNNMNIKHGAETDKLNIKPIVIGGAAITIGAFFISFIDSSKLINTKEIVTNTMDSIFGTMAKKQNKSSEQVLDELILEKQLEQVLNGDDSFIVSSKDLGILQEQALGMSQGIINYDMGCGIMPSSLSMNSLQDMMRVISGSSDPFVVGNAVEAALDNSISGTSDVSEENKQTIRDNFFQKMINKLTVKMLAAVTTAPQVRALMGISSSFINQGQPLLGKVSDDIKKWKILIKCMAREIMIMVAEFIFAIVMVYLIKLLKPIIVRVAKEQINQCSKMIKNLVGGRAARLAEVAAKSAGG